MVVSLLLSVYYFFLQGNQNKSTSLPSVQDLRKHSTEFTIHNSQFTINS